MLYNLKTRKKSNTISKNFLKNNHKIQINIIDLL